MPTYKSIYQVRKEHKAAGRTSRIRWGRLLMHGVIKKSPSGLTAKDYMINKKTGRVVSKKRHRAGKRLQRKMKAAGKLAPPFTSATAKLARKKAMKSRKRKTVRYSTNTQLYADYYDRRQFI